MIYRLTYNISCSYYKAEEKASLFILWPSWGGFPSSEDTASPFPLPDQPNGDTPSGAQKASRPFIPTPSWSQAWVPCLETLPNSISRSLLGLALFHPTPALSPASPTQHCVSSSLNTCVCWRVLPSLILNGNLPPLTNLGQICNSLFLRIRNLSVLTLLQ